MAPNRNMNERKSVNPRVMDPAAVRRDDRNGRMSKRQDEERVSHQRSHLSPRMIDNDLYERQSI